MGRCTTLPGSFSHTPGLQVEHPAETTHICEADFFIKNSPFRGLVPYHYRLRTSLFVPGGKKSDDSSTVPLQAAGGPDLEIIQYHPFLTWHRGKRNTIFTILLAGYTPLATVNYEPDSTRIIRRLPAKNVRGVAQCERLKGWMLRGLGSTSGPLTRTPADA